MPLPPHVPTPVTRDGYVDGPDGRRFVRTWSPATPSDAAPIVLLHDSLGCVALWRQFPAALCARTQRRVIAYDRLGFGRSAPYPGPLPLDFIATEAADGFAALRREFGLDRFVLFGHSVGGGIAVNIAARYGEACTALITESAQAFVEDRTAQGIRDARALFADPAQRARLHRYHDDKAEWVLDAWITSWLHPDFAAWSLAPALPQLSSPVLAIHGENDEYGSPRHPEMIARLAGGPARAVILSETGHVPHREREADVLTLVADFLHAPVHAA